MVRDCRGFCLLIRRIQHYVVLALGTVRCTTERLDGWVYYPSKQNKEPELITNINVFLKEMHVVNDEVLDKKVCLCLLLLAIIWLIIYYHNLL